MCSLLLNHTSLVNQDPFAMDPFERTFGIDHPFVPSDSHHTDSLTELSYTRQLNDGPPSRPDNGEVPIVGQDDYMRFGMAPWDMR